MWQRSAGVGRTGWIRTLFVSSNQATRVPLIGELLSLKRTLHAGNSGVDMLRKGRGRSDLSQPSHRLTGQEGTQTDSLDIRRILTCCSGLRRTNRTSCIDLWNRWNCPRRGLGLKDGPGSAGAATVSVWLRQGWRVRASTGRRRPPGRRALGELSAPGGRRPRTPLSMGSPPLVFYHPAACAERGRIFPAPARGNPAPPILIR
jgi:hypothetical protein